MSDRPVPASFRCRVVVVPAGRTRPFDEAEWRDAIVMVQHGEIELEGALGGRRRFERGAILWLVDLSLVAVHNRGGEPAVLVAISRRSAARPG